MDDARGMGRTEGRGDLQRNLHDRPRGELIARHVGLEVDSLDALHRDEGAPVGAVDLVNRADIRVIQLRDRVGFALEATFGIRVVGGFLGQKLEGDFPRQTDIFSSRTRCPFRHCPACQ